jgi:phosphatidylethanolamine-binding protein (PEBP) family uncharacterized protein
MRLTLVLSVLMIPALLALPMSAQDRGGRGAAATIPAGPAMTMTVMGFPDGGQIPVKFSQAAPGAAPGEGTSPAISWANPPAGTQSFVLNMHDMDVARNKTTDDQAHWVVWNIPATATDARRRPEGIAVAGRQLPNQRHRSCVPRPWRSCERSASSLHV